MAAPPTPMRTTPRHGLGLVGSKLVVLTILGTLAALSIIAAIIALHWPFREAAVIQQLEKAATGKVEIKNYRETYFPNAGCVAEGVTYRLAAGASPFARIDRLTIQSNIFGLMAHHIRSIQAEGVHVFVPPETAKTKFTGLSAGTTHIDKIEIHNAILEIPNKKAGSTPLQFKIHELYLEPATEDRPINFSAKLTNPEPAGEVTTSGQFGPWRGLQTPISGDYKFENADLGPFEGIAGILSSEGKFSGVLEHIDAKGKVNVPNFETKSAGHPIDLNSDFTAYITGANGDTFLDQIICKSAKTTVIAKGKVAGTSGRSGKTAVFDLESHNGRIEDILRLFTQAPRPAMAGEVSFKGKAMLPPGETRFLKKLEMEGDFGVSDSKLTSPTSQKKVDELSKSAQTETREKEAKSREEKKDEAQAPAPPVVSELKGHVTVKNATATFSSLSFYIPGAHAQMHGTYNLISEVVDLHGTLKMDSDLSDTAHGAKALMLKVLDPFFKSKKRKNGSDVPVKLTGTYHDPSFGMDLGGAGKKRYRGNN